MIEHRPVQTSDEPLHVRPERQAVAEHDPNHRHQPHHPHPTPLPCAGGAVDRNTHEDHQNRQSHACPRPAHHRGAQHPQFGPGRDSRRHLQLRYHRAHCDQRLHCRRQHGELHPQLRPCHRHGPDGGKQHRAGLHRRHVRQPGPDRVLTQRRLSEHRDADLSRRELYQQIRFLRRQRASSS